MLNQSGVTITSGTTRKTILVDEENSTALPCMISNTGITADANGNKIVKAGMPLAGSLTSRGTAFSVATDATNIAGIVMHDVDVTKGTANGAVLIFGTVDISKLETAATTALTTEIKQALKMIQFVS